MPAHGLIMNRVSSFCIFLFCVPPTTKIYTLSLHDALPISLIESAVSSNRIEGVVADQARVGTIVFGHKQLRDRDRKSTRLNSSHTVISYAVFCLKKKSMENGTVTGAG